MDAGGPRRTSPGYNQRMPDQHLEGGGLRTALDLFEAGVQLMRQNLRRAHAHATDEEIDALLHAWLHHRPGAEHGDCPGRPIEIAAASE